MSIIWRTCGLREGKACETPAEETFKKIKTKDPNIATKDGTIKMEEAQKAGNTLGIEEAKEPTAAIRKTTKTLMETKLGPGATKRSKGIMDTETGEDVETIKAVRPAKVITIMLTKS